MFMRYIHNEDNPVRSAADAVAARRREIVALTPTGPAEPTENVDPPITKSVEAIAAPTAQTRTSLGNYRPYRHRKDEERTPPPPSSRRRQSAEEDGLNG